MAGEEKSGGGDPLVDILIFVGVMAFFAVLWFMHGGPQKADLRGIFLAPPPPLGTGEAYGPDEGTTTQDSTETQ